MSRFVWRQVRYNASPTRIALRRCGSASLRLQRGLDATGANGTPTDPCFKGAEQSDEDKDRCEQPCLRNETTTGKKENNRKPAAGNAAFAVDIWLHSARRWG